MIIICPECTTKFRVNPDRIPDQGAKVRCARCKHIFWADKQKNDEPAMAPVTDEVPQAIPEEPQFTTAAPAEKPNINEEITTDQTESSNSEESDFDYDQFREQDSPQQVESFTFSSDTIEQETPTPAGEDPSTTAAEESFSFGEQQVDADNADSDPFSLAEDQPAATEPAAEAPAIEAPAAEHSVPAELPVKPKGGIFASMIRILLLLILSILIIGGVLLYMNGPEQLEQVIRQLTGQQTERPGEVGQITLDKLQGKFINNNEAGELFIIRGEAINKFAEPRAAIQVKGVIFDQNGKPLLQKTIFCGNPISDQELTVLPFNKIEELMGNQFGKAMNNMNLNKDQAIPFVIVFRDLPKSLSEFSADVTSSKPATP